MSKAGEFNGPAFTEPYRSKSYVRGPAGERRGPGYHSYGALVGEDAEGVRRAVLVGILGSMTFVLNGDSFEPLQFGREGIKDSGFFRYVIAGGRLYGTDGDYNNLTDLGVWPPRQAYICEPDPGIDNDDL